MATASPTPLGPGSHFTSLGRRTSARQALRRPSSSRPGLSRSESNPLSSSAGHAAPDSNRAVSQPQQYSAMHDSSDDEIPVPMKLSALTKALLNDGHASSEASSAPRDKASSPVQRPASRVMTRRSVMATSGSEARETRRHVRAGSANPQMNSSRPSSPVRSNASSSPVPRKRVVRLSHQQPVASSILQQGGSLPSRHRRSLSTSTNSRPPKRPESRERTDEKKDVQPAQPQSQQRQPSEARDVPPDVNTPVLPVRTVRIVVGSSGNRQRSGGSSGHRSASGHHSDAEQQHSQLEDPATVGRAPPGIAQGSVSRFAASVKKEDVAPASSMRSMKRVSKIPGSFLSGPARRGRRRQSEEDAEGEPEAVGSQERDNQQQQAQSQGGDYQAPSFYASSYRDFAATGSPVSAKDSARAAVARKQSPPKEVVQEHGSILESGKSHLDLPSYKALVPAQPIKLPSDHDKENDIPLPTSFFKSSMAAQANDQIKPLRPISVDLQPKQTSQHHSPERKVLAPKSQNTPHRLAPPPPPKMSVVETATRPAGAAQTKKRSILFRVNDRVYTRIECVGRGGSSKVYRVSAENGSMFALKRVSIENADETTVKGFKGEIDLLKRLTGVEKVIQLYDWELNEEKQMLSLLMEVGELDLHTLFKSRLGTEGHKLDTVFIRFFWKEMLECLAAVHAKDIVHSDLKPANFVVVKGRLKLIDFGIANAIQTDETVNVHRENQIGTPNYMSPESLMDSHQYAFTSAHNGRFNVPPPIQQPHHAKKLVKLGKPSDVWSLGCILYQMVYGDPPFAHIPNQMARCQSIINWNHAIEYPDKVGGTRVPLGLIRTMKRCLNREQKERPTCEELLSDSDPFLYPLEFDPEVFGAGDGKALPVTEELLGRIIQSVVQRCRERLPTDGEAMSAWPSAYWASVKKNVGV
ncbi:kinase-like domain-containing protein, partial [Coniochaeta sp. 2T2.1]